MKSFIKKHIIIFTGLFLLNIHVFSQDPNFYIFLCFGQSNMQGNATIEPQDLTVDSRLQVMESVNCSNLGRTKQSWYPAVPPLCRCYTGLTPADYFGKKLISNLPSNIKVGIVMVAVAGCKIELFDKVNYPSYVATAPQWMVDIINEYGGNPYAYLVELAKLAQKDGVIKGILLHQGESNTNDDKWSDKVKGVYDNLITDLGLKSDSVPLLAGEVVHADQGGACASMNAIIDELPNTLPNSYVISSSGCKDTSDNIHFNAAGYRELGNRYGAKMLSLLGYSQNTYLEAECGNIGADWIRFPDALASNVAYITAKPGLNSIATPPSESSGELNYSFNVDSDSTFCYARLNCATNNDDSFWVKVDNSAYVACDSLITNGWQWLKLGSFRLTKGSHTLTISYREDGAKLDKIFISKYDFAPSELGDVVKNYCQPGFPKLIEANVSNDGKSVEAKFSKLMANPANQLSNFIITLNRTTIGIDSVRLKTGNDSLMVFSLSNVAEGGDTLNLSYNTGSVASINNWGLGSFNNFKIKNTLPNFLLKSASTTTSGKTVQAKFNMSVTDPSSHLTSFSVMINSINTAIDSIRSDISNDSIITFYLSQAVKVNEKVILSYSSGSFASSDGYKLRSFSNITVTNSVPVLNLISAYTSLDGKTIFAVFNKPMANPSAQLSSFKIYKNSTPVTIDSVRLKSGNDSVMVFSLRKNLLSTDAILFFHYTSSVSGIDGEKLATIRLFKVTNNILTTGIGNINKSQTILFPNPAKDYISVKSSIPIEKVKIYNAMKQLVLEKQIDGAETELDISVLPDGTYILSVYMYNQEVLNRKLIKVK